MLRNNYSNSFLAILLLSVFSTTSFAQTNVSSPYSRYGLGNISETAFHGNRGMSGLSLALRNPQSINLSNPASYSSFNMNSFVFEIGVQTDGLKLTNTDTSQSTYNTSLSYLAFGFPVTKNWGSVFGLRPFSTTSYMVTNEQTLADIGDVSYMYEGTGGINEVYWGNALKLGNFSVGANLSYLFGPLNKSRSEIFSLANTFNYYTSEQTNIGGAYLKGGVQYEHVFDTIRGTALKNKVTIIAGAIMDVGTNLKGRRTTVGVTFDDYLLNPFLILPKDTILNVTDTGSLYLPGGYGVGLSVDIGNNWLLGCDYYSKSWSKFKSFDIQDSLGDYTRLVLGAQFTPDPNSGSSYFKTAQYRIGYQQENTYLLLRGQQLTKSGMSFGIGLPLKRIQSTLNLAFEFGTRGTTDNSLLQENYWIAGFGITLIDIWFIKRKYN